MNSLIFKIRNVFNQNNHYLGGMLMPKRKNNTSKLINGFNGKRYDNEVYGEGNFQDYGMRIYDPRIVRFPSVDPISSKYPMLTPYQFASNIPISGIDLDGLEYYYAADGTLIAKSNNNNTQVRLIKAGDVATAWQLLRRKGGATTADLNKISTDVGMTNGELNTRAFMSTLKQTENGGNAALGYNSKHGFTKGKINTFTNKTYEEAPEDYKEHPYKGKSGGSAAGAYQILSGSWENENDVQLTKIRTKYGVTDFSPINQDKMTLGIINDKKHSLDLIIAGDIHGAIEKLKKEWTSLPGASQSHIDMQTFDKLFKGNVSNEINNKSNLAVKKGETLKNVKPK